MKGTLYLAVALACAGCSVATDVFTNGGDGDGGAPSTTNGSGGDDVTVGSGGNTGTTTSTGGTTTTTTTTTTGEGGNAPVLACGDTSCAVQSDDDACCWDNYMVYGPPQGECVMGAVPSDGCTTSHPDENGQPGVETRIECQTSAHCAMGEVCCGTRRQASSGGQTFSYYERVTCETTCEYPSIKLCDTLQDSPSCPMLPTGGGGSVQGVCQSSQLLPSGYLVCGYP